jgi:hypothetical protein
MFVNNTAINWEHRMVAPFRGADSSVYLLGSSGANNNTTLFTRYDFNGENPADEPVPGEGQGAEGFDWVNGDTIIYTTYNPTSSRRRLALAQIEAEPFVILSDPRWNANGFIETSATTRIRNVRVGGQFSGHAYYGDAGQNDHPRLFAIDLATGIETALGDAGSLTGTGSFGLWTVVERGGLLYVQTTDDGIQVYEMNSATSLGQRRATYPKELLEELTGYAGQFWGFDVAPDGTLLLSGGGGLAYELEPQAVEPLRLAILSSADAVILSWSAAVTDAVIQAAADFEGTGFRDLDPQPSVEIVQGQNSATIPITAGGLFYRLRR